MPARDQQGRFVSQGGAARKGQVTDVDRGWNALRARVTEFRRKRVAVGILAGGTADASAGDGLTLLEVAIYNEFGTTDPVTGAIHVPERSFIRAWFDDHEAELRERMRGIARDVTAGKRDPRKALEQLALYCVGSIQERIASGISPDNAASTIARKGSSTPLIATGQLRSGVTSRIEDT